MRCGGGVSHNGSVGEGAPLAAQDAGGQQRWPVSPTVLDADQVAQDGHVLHHLSRAISELAHRMGLSHEKPPDGIDMKDAKKGVRVCLI